MFWCWQSFIQNCTETLNSQPILPVPFVDLISRLCEPVQRRGNRLCLCTPSLQFHWLTGSGVRQAFTTRHDYFLLPPSSHLLSRTTSLYPTPLPRPGWRRLTYLAVSLLIQKTSKQMRSSPVQRCRPAAHASCRETPHTCWLCTFPAKQRQMQ